MGEGRETCRLVIGSGVEDRLLPELMGGSFRVATLNIRGGHTPQLECKLTLSASVCLREGCAVVCVTETGRDWATHRDASFTVKRTTGCSLVAAPVNPDGDGLNRSHSGVALVVHPVWASHLGHPRFLQDRVVAAPFHFIDKTIWVVGIYQHTAPHTLNRVKATLLIEGLRTMIHEIEAGPGVQSVYLMGDFNETIEDRIDRPFSGGAVPPRQWSA